MYILVVYSSRRYFNSLRFNRLMDFVYDIKTTSGLKLYLDFLIDTYKRSKDSKTNSFLLQTAIGHHLIKCDREDCLCFITKENADELTGQKEIKSYLPIFDKFVKRSKKISNQNLLLNVFNDIGKVESMKEQHMANLKKSESDRKSVV